MAAINLLELFNGRIFKIPDYQRGYAWEDKQLQELWDDIDEITSYEGEFKKHYTGTIYLEKTEPYENEKWVTSVTFFDIVDGQQRMTTLCIFLNELLKLTERGYSENEKGDLIKTYLRKSNLDGRSTVYKFSYYASNRNYNFLMKNIFEDQSVVTTSDVRNLYSKNLNYAKEFFQKKLEALSHDDREKIFLKITSSLHFDIRTIEKDLDVQAVFETMNNRGKPLTALEKLKNRLIYLSGDFA